MAETVKKNETSKSTASKAASTSAGRAARAGTDKATSATDGAKSAATGAKSAAAGAKSAVSGASEKMAGHVATLGSKAKAGGEKLAAVPGKSVQLATTTWTLVQNRKAIAAGVGGGAVAALAGAFALGRTAARRGQGPITRATGGRF
ncbi:hypothetical protein [Streptomyces sp. NPDC002564]|uniref:hypothetical protein n=1 Tax=Streptomyces sp. NPDC002564 TaxID=3364649 RepID=UPI00369C9475